MVSTISNDRLASLARKKMKRRRLLHPTLLGLLVSLAGLTELSAAAESASGMVLEGFQASPARPRLRLLVVGDSTAVGTGASAPAQSLVGLIGRAHPDWMIRNLALDGAKLEDIAAQLRVGAESYDRLLILGGGNDVIRLSSLPQMREQLNTILALAKQRSSKVVLMPAGNVGNAPFFFWPLSRWMTQRSRELHALAAQLAAVHEVRYVRLFKERADDPFVAQAELLHAEDGIHPSDAGYALWLRELQAQAPGLF